MLSLVILDFSELILMQIVREQQKLWKFNENKYQRKKIFLEWKIMSRIVLHRNRREKKKSQCLKPSRQYPLKAYRREIIFVIE